MKEEDMTDQNRIIGRLEGQQAATIERVERIEAKVDSLDAKVDAILEKLAEAKGGIRIIWAVATAGGIIGVSLVKIGSLLLSALKGP